MLPIWSKNAWRIGTGTLQILHSIIRLYLFYIRITMYLLIERVFCGIFVFCFVLFFPQRFPDSYVTLFLGRPMTWQPLTHWVRLHKGSVCIGHQTPLPDIPWSSHHTDHPERGPCQSIVLGSTQRYLVIRAQRERNDIWWENIGWRRRRERRESRSREVKCAHHLPQQAWHAPQMAEHANPESDKINAFWPDGIEMRHRMPSQGLACMLQPQTPSPQELVCKWWSLKPTGFKCRWSEALLNLKSVFCSFTPLIYMFCTCVHAWFH